MIFSQKSYEPRRLFKHKDDVKREESTKFLGTVLEYEAPLYSIKIASPSAEIASTDVKENENKEELKEKVNRFEITFFRISV